MTLIIILQGSTCLLCFRAAYCAEASGTTFVCSVVLLLNGSWSPQRAAGKSRGTVCMCNALPNEYYQYSWSWILHQFNFFLQEIWRLEGYNWECSC